MLFKEVWPRIFQPKWIINSQWKSHYMPLMEILEKQSLIIALNLYYELILLWMGTKDCKINVMLWVPLGHNMQTKRYYFALNLISLWYIFDMFIYYQANNTAVCAHHKSPSTLASNEQYSIIANVPKERVYL